MKTPHLSSSAIRAAQKFVAGSDVPLPHRNVLLDIVALALKNAEEAERNDDTHWQPEDVQIVATELTGKTAVSWQNADELLIRLAARLHRDPDEVKSKATELGFGVSVDYRLARSLAARGEQ